jgi:hypothetical protein
MPQESSVFQQLREAPIWDQQLQLKRGDYLQHAGVSNTNVYLILEGCFYESTFLKMMMNRIFALPTRTIL